MSKARLVITAVIIEGRTQAEVAKSYGVSKGWVSKLIARYNAEGEGHHHDTVVSRYTISRHLAKAGLVVAEPRKRPKSSYLRFEAAMPNQTWQSDFTQWDSGRHLGP